MKNRNKIKLAGRLLLLAVAGMLLAGCGAARQGVRPADGDDEKGEKLRVVTTLFPYYDFVRQVAGSQVELTLVVPAGMDSHSFEPTPADMRTIQSADVLIYNGGVMEQWVSDVLGAIDTSQMKVTRLMDYVDVVEEEIVEGMEDEVHDHDHDHVDGEEIPDDGHAHVDGDHIHGDAEDVHDDDYFHVDGEEIPDDGHGHEIEYDEHIWTSPVNAMRLVEVICDTLSDADPAHEEDYRAGADAYLRRLQEIDDGFREVSAARRRSTIVVGDKFPFRYLAEEYGLNYRAAFSGCSTDTEPSARTIAYLIDKVRDEQIPVVYYLELSSHRVSEIIGEETGAVPLLLHSCHNVTRAELEGGVTYADLMEQNIENLRKGLDK